MLHYTLKYTFLINNFLFSNAHSFPENKNEMNGVLGYLWAHIG